MECNGWLKRSTIEILWHARYYLRVAADIFLKERSHVKKFAATCPCEMCTAWRGRLMDKALEDAMTGEEEERCETISSNDG